MARDYSVPLVDEIGGDEVVARDALFPHFVHGEENAAIVRVLPVRFASCSHSSSAPDYYVSRVVCVQRRS